MTRRVWIGDSHPTTSTVFQVILSNDLTSNWKFCLGVGTTPWAMGCHGIMAQCECHETGTMVPIVWLWMTCSHFSSGKITMSWLPCHLNWVFNGSQLLWKTTMANKGTHAGNGNLAEMNWECADMCRNVQNAMMKNYFYGFYRYIVHRQFIWRITSMVFIFTIIYFYITLLPYGGFLK